MHINHFSQETQDFIHELFANAIVRAIKNGTFKNITPVLSEDQKDGDS